MKFLAYNSRTRENIVTISDREMKYFDMLVHVIRGDIPIDLALENYDPISYNVVYEEMDFSETLEAIVRFLCVSNLLKSASEKLSELTAMFKRNENNSSG